MTPLPLQSGAIVQSVTPHTFGPGEYGALRNSGAQGPITVHGYSPSDSQNLFRLNDGSSDLVFDGLEFTGLWRVWITAAKNLTLKNGHSHHMRMEGMILGACEDVLIEDWLAEYCGPQYMNGYSDSSHHEPSADHAFYAQNYGGKRTTMRRCTGRHVSGSGLHLYGDGDSHEYGSEFTGEDLAFLYCGSEGTPAIQPDGTDDSSLKNVLVAHSPIGGFTWGNGDGMPCRNWTIDGLTMWNPDAKFNIHVAPGTSGITYRNSIFVLADAPLCESTEGGPPEEWPVFEGCLFYVPLPVSDYLPPGVLPGNTVKPISEAAALFPRALKGDFTPTDPGAPGFRDWRVPAPAPTPQPAPTPPPPPAPDPLAKVRAALAELDEPLSSLAHHVANAKNATLKAALKADQKALAAGVAKAKAAAR